MIMQTLPLLGAADSLEDPGTPPTTGRHPLNFVVDGNTYILVQYL